MELKEEVWGKELEFEEEGRLMAVAHDKKQKHKTPKKEQKRKGERGPDPSSPFFRRAARAFTVVSQ